VSIFDRIVEYSNISKPSAQDGGRANFAKGTGSVEAKGTGSVEAIKYLKNLKPGSAVNTYAIGKQFGIAPATVRGQVERNFPELRLQTREESAAIAKETRREQYAQKKSDVPIIQSEVRGKGAAARTKGRDITGVTFSNKEKENKYIKYLEDRYSDVKGRKGPSNEQLAVEFYGEATDANVSKIEKINRFYRKDLKLDFKPAPISEVKEKRTRRLAITQGGRSFKGTEDIPFHHIMPIGGEVDLTTKDVAFINKQMNSKLAPYNTKLNDIADAISNQLNNQESGYLKRIDELNNQAEQIIESVKTRLPKKYQNYIGFNRLDPILDENATPIRLNVTRVGVDDTKSLAGKRGEPIKLERLTQKNIDEIKKLKYRDLNKLIASLSDNPACAVFAGKRGKFDVGGSPNANIDDCLQGGIKVINSGKIPPNKASQFANFTKKASTLGGNIMKIGIIPEAIYVAADGLIRMGLGDTFKEAGLRASEYLLPGDQTKKADMLKVERTLGAKAAKIVGRAIDYRNQLSKIDFLKQEKQSAEALSPTSEFDYLPDGREDIQNIDKRIEQAEFDLTNKFMIPEKEKGYAERAEQEAYDISKAKSPFVKALSYLRSVQPVENDPLAETAPEKQIDLSLFPTLPTEFMEKNNTELISYTNKLRELGYEVTPKEVMAERDKLKKMPLEQMAQEYSPEQIYGTQGEGAFFGEPLAGGGIAKLAGVSKGPPPESGPNPQGLNYLIKRVTNS
jgi:hypothetical protein